MPRRRAFASFRILDSPTPRLLCLNPCRRLSLRFFGRKFGSPLANKTHRVRSRARSTILLLRRIGLWIRSARVRLRAERLT